MQAGLLLLCIVLNEYHLALYRQVMLILHSQRVLMKSFKSEHPN